jgi:hypothetical protein
MYASVITYIAREALWLAIYLKIQFLCDKNVVGFTHVHWCQLCIGSQSGQFMFPYSFLYAASVV